MAAAAAPLLVTPAAPVVVGAIVVTGVIVVGVHYGPQIADSLSNAASKVKAALKDAVATETCQNCQPKFWDVTYTKSKIENGRVVVYSGRTSGFGATPEEVLERRDAGHHQNAEGFGPAKLDKAVQSSGTPRDMLARAAIRGREQMLIDHYGGAQSTGGTSGNRINGIAETNPLRGYYLAAAMIKFGPI